MLPPKRILIIQQHIFRPQCQTLFIVGKERRTPPTRPVGGGFGALSGLDTFPLSRCCHLLNQRHCSFGVYLAQDRMALKAELGSSSSLPLRRKAGGTEVEKHVAGASFAPYFGSLFRFNPTWQWRLSLENEDCPICLAEDGRTYFSGSNRSGPNGKPLCRIGIAEVRSD